MLVAIVAACALAAPWSFGAVRTGEVEVARYAASNLALNHLPPTSLNLARLYSVADQLGIPG